MPRRPSSHAAADTRAAEFLSRAVPFVAGCSLFLAAVLMAVL